MSNEVEEDAEGHAPVRDALFRRSPSVQVVHAAILDEGREELERPSAALAWSGLAAGLSMGFSMVAEGVLHARLPDAEWTPLVSKLGYTVGFLFVTLGRQQLFTESTLVAVLPVLHDRGERRVGQLARLWTVVLLANLLGAFAFAAAAANTGIFSPEVKHAFDEMAREAMAHSFLDDVLKGIVGGWLVALMVWLLPASESARFWTIVVTAWLIGAGELTHVIAGAIEAFYLVASGAAGLDEAFGGYILPVLIGNTIGGVTFVAALNHAQAKAGK